MKRIISAALILLLAFAPGSAAAFSLSGLFSDSDSRAVQFKWQDANGKTVSIDQYRGKPLLIHLWASWCPSCRDEMPAFTQWMQNHPQVTTLPVSLDSKLADAVSYLKSGQMEIPVLLTNEAQARNLGARALPTTVVVAADGSVKQLHRGPRNWADKTFTDNLLQSLKTGRQTIASQADGSAP